MPTAVVSIHPNNVQATVAHTYARDHCRYLFFTFGSPKGARAFVGRLFPKVISAEDVLFHGQPAGQEQVYGTRGPPVP